MFRFIALVALISVLTWSDAGAHDHRNEASHRPLHFNPKETRHREHLMGHLDDFVKRQHGGNEAQNAGQPAQGQAPLNPQDSQPNAFTDEELEFHYFRSSDYDHNNLLDGLEILKALLEETSHKDEGDHHEDGAARTVMTDEELANLVDAVMGEQDKNRDGYIDYTEFAAAQRIARDQTTNNAL